MAMPKGFKSKNGYGTTKSLGGKSYHEIADHMVDSGFKMNHSTARNVFLTVMRKFAKDLCELYDVEPTSNRVESMASDPRFQSSICGMLSDI